MTTIPTSTRPIHLPDSIPVVAAPHPCGGESCDFCEWSNPTLDIPQPKAGET